MNRFNIRHALLLTFVRKLPHMSGTAAAQRRHDCCTVGRTSAADQRHDCCTVSRTGAAQQRHNCRTVSRISAAHQQHDCRRVSRTRAAQQRHIIALSSLILGDRAQKRDPSRYAVVRMLVLAEPGRQRRYPVSDRDPSPLAH